MPEVIVSLLIGLGSLFLSDYMGKHKILPKEVSRKIPHILIAVAVATWPFFVSYQTIVITCLVVLAAAIFSKRIGLFTHLREVGRLSWGDMFLPLGIITAALLEPNKWVFAAAMLNLGLADSLAAIIGTKHGKHSFVYLGHKKSLEGSAAFLITAFVITYLLLFIVPSGLEHVPAIAVLAFPIVITAVEALAPFGTDNLFIPVITAGIFTITF